VVKASIAGAQLDAWDADVYLRRLMTRTGLYVGCERQDICATHWASNSAACAKTVDKHLTKKIKSIKEATKRIAASPPRE
jgi:hypothetical protein